MPPKAKAKAKALGRARPLGVRRVGGQAGVLGAPDRARQGRAEARCKRGRPHALGAGAGNGSSTRSPSTSSNLGRRWSLRWPTTLGARRR